MRIDINYEDYELANVKYLWYICDMKIFKCTWNKDLVSKKMCEEGFSLILGIIQLALIFVLTIDSN